jgi:hypothetical protein
VLEYWNFCDQMIDDAVGAKEFDAMMKRLRHVQAGRGFSRDEMNAR